MSHMAPRPSCLLHVSIVAKNAGLKRRKLTAMAKSLFLFLQRISGGESPNNNSVLCQVFHRHFIYTPPIPLEGPLLRIWLCHFYSHTLQLP